MGYKTNTEMIFYVLQLFNQLTSSFGMVLPGNFSRTAQFIASVVRLDKILHAEELVSVELEKVEKPSILLKDVTLEIRDKEILKGMTLYIPIPGLTIITGPVGSGKSSLMKVILQDYQPIKSG